MQVCKLCIFHKLPIALRKPMPSKNTMKPYPFFTWIILPNNAIYKLSMDVFSQKFIYTLLFQVLCVSKKFKSEINENQIDKCLIRIHKSTVPNVSLLTGGPIRNILLSAYTTQKASSNKIRNSSGTYFGSNSEAVPVAFLPEV